VHPYAETDTTTPRVHDLFHLLDTDELQELSRAPAIVAAAAAITGLQPISEVVQLARQTSTADLENWVADSTDPEGSYNALANLARTASRGG